MSEIYLNRIRRGSGNPPIVLVHGFLCHHQDWCHQVSHFAPRHTVVACDLRGHGVSPRGDAPMSIETLGEDVAAMLAEEDLNGAVLVGHSMGCRVVMEARRQAPSRVAGLVLVDGSRVANDRESGQNAFDTVVEEEGYEAVVRGLFEDMFFGEPPNWKDDLLANVLAAPKKMGCPLFRAMIAWDAEILERALDEIRVPVLVIQSTTMGVDRKRRPLEAGETGPYQSLILDRLVGAESETIAGPGHFCMKEAPDAINGRIERFLAERF
jgi:pimeloyl-ACP methyl ester carboxylesterase